MKDFKVVNYFVSCSNEQANLLNILIGSPTCSITTNEFKTNGELPHLIRGNNLYLGNFDINWNYVPSVSKEILDKFKTIELIYLKMADRLGYLLSYQERKYAYNKTLRFWLWFFEKYRVEKAVFVNIPHHGYDYIAMEVLRFLGVDLLMFYELPVIPGKSYSLFEVQDSSDHSRFLKIKYRQIQKNKGNVQVIKKSTLAFKQFSQEAMIPPFTRQESTKENLFMTSLKKLIKFLDVFFSQICKGNLWNISKIKKALFIQSYYTGIFLDPFFSTPKTIRNYYESLSSPPDLNAKFVYFALHFQPEMTTSPLGEHFVDQVLAIDILAKASKKLGVELYVKEHPRAVNRTESRTKAFYDQLLLHENVRLIDRNFDSVALIDNSICVSSITGTVNFEAIFRRKKAISFGNVFYNAFDMVENISSEKEAVKVISSVLSTDYVTEDTDIEDCLLALDAFTIDGFHISEEEDIATVSKEVSDKNITNRIDLFLKS